MATATPPTAATESQGPPRDHDGSAAERRFVLHGVSWETYQRLSAEVGDRRVLKSYNRGVLEFLSPEVEHEGYRDRLHQLILVVTDDRRRPAAPPPAVIDPRSSTVRRGR